MTEQQKRRERDLRRTIRTLEETHRAREALDEQVRKSQVEAADAAGRDRGLKLGFESGAKFASGLVLEHAGRLFKEGKDKDAAAVREVHRQITQNGVKAAETTRA